MTDTNASRISQFRLEYDFLSNFYPAVLTIDGLTYLNSEAAYQACKCKNPDDMKQFCELTSDEAKRLGRKIELREDWEKIKVSVMRRVIYAKFTQNPHLAEYLLDTEERILEEGNTWHDVTWGVDLKTGEGLNLLGKLLMELRADLRENGIPESNESSVVYRTFTSHDGITAAHIDITLSDCECIVNPLSGRVGIVTGFDAALHRAAGSKLLQAMSALDRLKVAETVITEGFELKSRYVIHTMGPHYKQPNDELLLAKTYENVLELAEDSGIHSIAFPVISVGRFSYPKDKAIFIAVKAVRAWLAEHPDSELKVSFCVLDIVLYNYLEEALKSAE